MRAFFQTETITSIKTIKSAAAKPTVTKSIVTGMLTLALAHGVQAGDYCDDDHKSYESKNSSTVYQKPSQQQVNSNAGGRVFEEEAQFEPLSQAPAPQAKVIAQPAVVPVQVPVQKTVVASKPAPVETITTAPVEAVQTVQVAQNEQVAVAEKPVEVIETAVANVATASTESLEARLAQGKTLWEGTCQGCHASGALGAPKIGDKAAWSPRVTQGLDTLVSHAINGFNSMPARGGNSSLSDEQVGLAVQYMVSVTNPEIVK